MQTKFTGMTKRSTNLTSSSMCLMVLILQFVLAQLLFNSDCIRYPYTDFQFGKKNVQDKITIVKQNDSRHLPLNSEVKECEDKEENKEHNNDILDYSVEHQRSIGWYSSILFLDILKYNSHKSIFVALYILFHTWKHFLQ